MYWPNIAGHPWLSSKTLCAHLAVFRGTIRVWHLPLYWRIVLYIVHCIVSYIVLYLVVPLLQEGVRSEWIEMQTTGRVRCVIDAVIASSCAKMHTCHSSL